MPNARAVGVEAIARRALANGQLVADSLAPSLGCGPPIYALLLGGDLEGGDPWGAPGPLTVALRTAAMLGEPSAARSRLAEAATLLENTPHTLEGSKGARKWDGSCAPTSKGTETMGCALWPRSGRHPCSRLAVLGTP